MIFPGLKMFLNFHDYGVQDKVTEGGDYEHGTPPKGPCLKSRGKWQKKLIQSFSLIFVNIQGTINIS